MKEPVPVKLNVLLRYVCDEYVNGTRKPSLMIPITLNSNSLGACFNYYLFSESLSVVIVGSYLCLAFSFMTLRFSDTRHFELFESEE
jgi:hypothetical protein